MRSMTKRASIVMRESEREMMDSEETRDQKWERCGDLVPLGEIAERLLRQIQEIQRIMEDYRQEVAEFSETKEG